MAELTVIPGEAVGLEPGIQICCKRMQAKLEIPGSRIACAPRNDGLVSIS